METKRKIILDVTDGEQASDVLIKRETEWLAENTHAPDLSHQELEEDMKLLRSIKSKEAPYHTYAHTGQGFTPLHYTDEYIKTELILDEEVMDNMHDSEANYKQLVLDDGSTDSNQILENSQAEKAAFACEICSRSFKTKRYLKVHLMTHDTDRERKFACDFCEKRFHNNKGLCRHRKVHTGGEYQCKVCGKFFTRKESLKLHLLRRQHFDETQQFTPQSSNDAMPTRTGRISDKVFIDEDNACDSVPHTKGTQLPGSAVDDEQRTRVGVVEQSEICKVCHNSYPGQLIKMHMRMVHSDHKCQFCTRVFLRRSGLKRHIEKVCRSTFEKDRSTQNDNRLRPYACEQCGFKFIAEAYLKSHMITQHTKNRKPEFNCQLCEKKFYTKLGRKQHMRTHTAETIRCEVCGTHFTHPQTLKSHMACKHTAKADPQTANDFKLQIKEESISNEKFLHTEI